MYLNLVLLQALQKIAYYFNLFLQTQFITHLQITAF
jgi:hypothetical protein